MMLTPHAPHAPYTPAPRHKGTLKGLVQPIDPAFNMVRSDPPPKCPQHLLLSLPSQMTNTSMDELL